MVQAQNGPCCFSATNVACIFLSNVAQFVCIGTAINSDAYPEAGESDKHVYSSTADSTEVRDHRAGR